MNVTLPVGIPVRQYPWVIYPLVCEQDNDFMEREEHWRLRLLELKADLQLKQAEIAQKIGVEPNYVSRLLYPPLKNGRKNLGLETLRALQDAFGLSADWFDLPLGSHLPSAQRRLRNLNSTNADPSTVLPIEQVVWPFKHVTYRRLTALRAALGSRLGPSAMNDIDELLDVVVIKWERFAVKQKKPTDGTHL